MPPVTTSRGARDRGQRRSDEAAGARLRGRQRPAELAAAVEHDLLHPTTVGRVEVPPEPLRQRRLELEHARSSALGSADEVDVDLEAAGADRHLEPVAVAAGLLEGLRDLRLAGAEEAQRPPQRRRAPVEHAAHVGGLERARPEPLQLRRRPGQHDHRRPVCVDDEAGRRAGEAEDRRRPRARSPAWSPPPRSPRTGRFIRSATMRETPSICASSSASTRMPSPATFATIATVRSSCVGPSPPDVRDEIGGADGLARRPPRAPQDRRRRSGSASARRPSASSERARNGPFRSVRSPRTSSLPVTTMTARGRAPFAPVKPRRPRRSSSPSRRRPAP